MSNVSKKKLSLPTVQQPAARWAFVLAVCASLGVVVSYYWRVFYGLDARGVSAAGVTGLCVGLAVLAEPIIRLLAGNYGPESVATATPILAYLGIAVVFNSTVLLFNAIMQAHGDVTTPVINMLIGGIVKVVVNYILVAIPSLNIIGAPIGTLVCYIAITALDLVSMRRHISARPTIFKNIVRPLIASALMGGATFLVYRVLSSRLGSWKLSCLVSLAFAVVLYAVLVVALQCVTYEDCMLLPKGEKIAKLLKIQKKS